MSVLDRSSFIKKIFKENFYRNINLTSAQKNKFTKYIDSILLLNKFANETTNLPEGNFINEILFFEITLKDENYIFEIEDLLIIIDRNVPYHTIFKFKFKDEVVCKIAYKEQNKADVSKFVVNNYYTRFFTSNDDLNKKLLSCFNATNMDDLYENIMYLFLFFEEENLIESLKKQDKFIALGKKIKDLRKKILKEKQANKQFDLYNQFNASEKELNSLKKDIKKVFKYDVEEEEYI